MDAARLFARVSVAGADQAKRDLQSVGRQVDQTQGRLDKLSDRATANLARGTKDIARGLSRIALVGTAAVGAGLGFAAKEALDFQEAFALVRKTVEGSPEELNKIDKALRSLSTRVPVRYDDLAGIAQEAGALDVPTNKVAAFTETVARLTAATVGLTTEAAAEAFGKFGTIFPEVKQGERGYERMGSALIELGRKAASSESDIISVTTRFAAAGAKAGLTVPQILGMASAISSLGVEPEAAGGAMSRIFNKITTLIATGDEKVKAFAKATGMSVKEFSDFFRRDANGAVTTFLESLSKLDKFQAARILKAGGFSNVRDINVIQLLSRAHEELARQQGIATDAYAKNTALQEVSAQRFETLRSKITMFGNTIRLAAAEMGEGFTPALGRLIDKATKFVTDHMPDIKQMGVDIGKAIDSINWTQVEDGAKAVADAAKTILDIIRSMPGEVDAVAAGLLGLAAANKLTFGALGSIGGGVFNVGKGMVGLAARIGSLLPGRAGAVAGVVGAATATPVFVTNWPPLGGLGGGLTALPGGAAAGAAGAGLMGTLTTLAGLLAVAAPAIATAAVAWDQSNRITQQGAGLGAQTADFAKTASDRELAKSIDGLRGQIDAMGTGIGSNVFNQKGIAVELLNTLIAEQNRRYLEANRQGPSPTVPDRDANARTSGWYGNDPEAQRLSGRGLQYHEMVVALQRATGPAAIMRGARELAHQFLTLGLGGSARTREVLDEFRRQRAAATDPNLIRALDGWIERLERRLPSRDWVSQTLAKAKVIAAQDSTAPGARISALRDLEQTAAARGNNALARRIHRMIESERIEARDASRAAERAAKRAAAAADSVNHWRPAVYVYPGHVTLTVDGRTFGSAVYQSTGQFTRSGAGPTQRPS